MPRGSLSFLASITKRFFFVLRRCTMISGITRAISPRSLSFFASSKRRSYSQSTSQPGKRAARYSANLWVIALSFALRASRFESFFRKARMDAHVSSNSSPANFLQHYGLAQGRTVRILKPDCRTSVTAWKASRISSGSSAD
jgi:hypothetical protein